LYFPRAWKVIAGFVIAGITGLAFYFLPLFQSAATATVNTGPVSVPVPNPLPTTTQPFTVLLLGSDDDAKFPQDRVNTQSMILVRVDPGTKQATMLSIPRDLWVSIPGQGMGKISTAYQTGGADGAIAVVESNFKVHIDDYVWIGLEGLVKLIDHLGGVDMLVTNPVLDDFYPADINTNDPYGTTASQCCRGQCTSTACTPCSTFAPATATYVGTLGGPNASSSCWWRSKPGPLTSTRRTCPS